MRRLFASITGFASAHPEIIPFIAFFVAAWIASPPLAIAAFAVGVLGYVIVLEFRWAARWRSASSRERRQASGSNATTRASRAPRDAPPVRAPGLPFQFLVGLLALVLVLFGIIVGGLSTVLGLGAIAVAVGIVVAVGVRVAGTTRSTHGQDGSSAVDPGPGPGPVFQALVGLLAAAFVFAGIAAGGLSSVVGIGCIALAVGVVAVSALRVSDVTGEDPVPFLAKLAWVVTRYLDR